MKRHVWIGLAGVALAASWTWAQEVPQPPGQSDPPAQQRMRQQREARRMEADPWRIRELEQILDLTPEQTQKAREMAAKMPAAPAKGTRPAANRYTVAEVRRQLLEAAKAGQDDRVQQLERQLQDLTGMSRRRQAGHEFHNVLAKILTSEQTRTFQAWRQLQEINLPPAAIARPEVLKASAMKIQTLSDVQKRSIEAIVERHQKQAEALRAGAAPARRALGVRTAVEIVGVLTPSQKVLLVEQAREARRMPGRQGDGERPRARASRPAEPPNPTRGQDAGPL